MGCPCPVQLTLHSQTGRHCPAQMKAWASKIKLTTATGGWIGI